MNFIVIRWKKLAPLAAVFAIAGLFPLGYELIYPERMSGITCVRTYPDGRIEKDWGESCYDKTLPEAIVLKSQE